MRTNIDIDDDLMDEALALSGLPTKKTAVEEGLRLLIRMHRQASVRNAYGKLPLQLDLDTSRLGRRS